MFEAVLFDMDGLFIDSEPDWHAAETEMMRGYGYDWTPADQLKCLGGPLLRVTQYMSECLDGARSAEELGLTIVAQMKKRVSKSVSLMPGALEFSRKLNGKGIPQALVSASPREIVDAVLLGMKEKYFAFSVAAGDIERTKPFPDPYLEAAKRMNVAPSECVVFEDSLTGISSAQEAGCAVIAVPHYVEVIESRTLKVAQSLHEVNGKVLKEFYNGL
jgi:HAD superfamily hydrolase (TIGR01509 family)